MIPKTIHYCWFGDKKKPKVVRDCIASWEKFLPDYKIIEWTEKNTDLKHPFVKRAYLEKQWAFVADFVRLEKLLIYGGVYLDTDMLLLKSITNLLDDQGFIGIESKKHISCGIIGAVPQHPYLKECFNFYDKLIIDCNFSYSSILIPKIFTSIYLNRYPAENTILKPTSHKDLMVYPIDYFYPFPNENLPIEKFTDYITPFTYAVHLWNKSWKKNTALDAMKQGKILKSLYILTKEFISREKIVNKNYLKKIGRALKYQISNG